MQIEQLTARSFRNLAPLELHSEGRSVVLQGPNGAGKTNILEALYLCATGRSFRHATAPQLLAHGAPYGQVEATLQRQEVRHTVLVQLQATHRGIRVDGRALRQASQLLQLVNVVAFFPDDLRVAKGSPEERRRFLDRAVANSEAPFMEAATRYLRALRSRNALLRAPGALDRRLVAPYDAQLVTYGAVVHDCRAAALTALQPLAQRHFAALMPELGTLQVALRDGLDGAAAGAPEDPYAARLEAALGRGYGRDRARGTTHVGPHRADLWFGVDGHDMRSFASQGQQRALVLALKLAEVVLLAERLGTPPVLLLDDVSSELDRARSERLFAVVGEVGCQAWVSTTGAAALPMRPGARWLEVRDGACRPLPTAGAA